LKAKYSYEKFFHFLGFGNGILFLKINSKNLSLSKLISLSFTYTLSEHIFLHFVSLITMK